MNVDDEAKVDRILPLVNTFVPGPSPELFGAIGTFTVDEVCIKGWHPTRKAVVECRSEWALARSLLLVFDIHKAITSYTAHVLRLRMPELLTFRYAL